MIFLKMISSRKLQRYEELRECKYCTNKFIVKTKNKQLVQCDQCRKTPNYLKYGRYNNLSQRKFIHLVNQKLKENDLPVKFKFSKSGQKVGVCIDNLSQYHLKNDSFKNIDFKKRDFNINSTLLEAQKIYNKLFKEYYS